MNATTTTAAEAAEREARAFYERAAARHERYGDDESRAAKRRAYDRWADADEARRAEAEAAGTAWWNN